MLMGWNKNDGLWTSNLSIIYFTSNATSRNTKITNYSLKITQIIKLCLKVNYKLGNVQKCSY